MMNRWLLPLLALLFLTPAKSPGDELAAATPGLVYVIPIHDMIEPALLLVIRRGVAEADRAGANAIIFTMDTPGGTVNAAREIVYTIQRVGPPTYTLVEKNAFSAGAIISLATDKIYMTPGSVIGDAMPIMMSPMGGAQPMPEDIQEKMVSGVAALIRATAQQKGHDAQLAEAMVRRELEYKIGDEVICKEGELLTLTNIEAERLVGEDQHKLLSSGTVDDLEALLKEIGLEGATIQTLEVTDSERVARWIAKFASFFLMAGLLGIYLEIKTPGFGIFGILGVIALAIFFWGHRIAGLSGNEEVLLFALGAALLLVEIFITPGFGIPGVTGIMIIFWALLSAMMERYPGGPVMPEWPQVQLPLFKLSFSFVLFGIVAISVARFLPKSNLLSRLILQQSTLKEEGYAASDVTTSDRVDQIGTTLTRLRPAGSAMFGPHKLDVVTRGDFIDAEKAVRVVEAHGNRIVVEEVDDSGENA